MSKVPVKSQVKVLNVARKAGKEIKYQGYWITRTKLLVILYKIKEPIGKYTHIAEYYNRDGSRKLTTLLHPDEARRKYSPVYHILYGEAK